MSRRSLPPNLLSPVRLFPGSRTRSQTSQRTPSLLPLGLALLKVPSLANGRRSRDWQSFWRRTRSGRGVLGMDGDLGSTQVVKVSTSTQLLLVAVYHRSSGRLNCPPVCTSSFPPLPTRMSTRSMVSTPTDKSVHIDVTRPGSCPPGRSSHLATLSDPCPHRCWYNRLTPADRLVHLFLHRRYLGRLDCPPGRLSHPWRQNCPPVRTPSISLRLSFLPSIDRLIPVPCLPLHALATMVITLGLVWAGRLLPPAIKLSTWCCRQSHSW